jgi:phosphatidylinositol glycan class S
LLRLGLPSPSSAFLLPQWGGIVIYNPPADVQTTAPFPAPALTAVFTTFAAHLLALLGVPALPPSISTSASASDVLPTTPLTAWQLDALLRARALENARNAQGTLESIVSLVAQIENMPVGRDVRGDVQGALGALEEVRVSPFLPPTFLFHFPSFTSLLFPINTLADVQHSIP